MFQIKRNFLKLIFISLSALSFNVHAEVAIELGEGINLLAVNGEEVDTDSFFADKTTARLPQGINQILVNYIAEVKPGDDSELEVTQPSVILFETVASKVSLSAPKIKSIRDVEMFEKNLNWTLTDEKGNPVPYKANLLIKKGLQLSRDYEDELEDFNLSNAESALQKIKIVSPIKVSNAKNQKNSETKNNNNMAMDMLIYWYNQADEKTRRSFKELINK